MIERSYEITWDVRVTRTAKVTESELAALLSVVPAKIAERLEESGAMAAGLKGDLRPAVDPLDKITDQLVNARLDNHSRVVDEVVQNVEVELA